MYHLHCIVILIQVCTALINIISSNITAICNPACLNGGVCTAPDTCDCTAVTRYAGADCNTRKYDHILTFITKHLTSNKSP